MKLSLFVIALSFVVNLISQIEVDSLKYYNCASEGVYFKGNEARFSCVRTD